MANWNYAYSAFKLFDHCLSTRFFLINCSFAALLIANLLLKQNTRWGDLCPAIFARLQGKFCMTLVQMWGMAQTWSSGKERTLQTNVDGMF